MYCVTTGTQITPGLILQILVALYRVIRLILHELLTSFTVCSRIYKEQFTRKKNGFCVLLIRFDKILKIK